MSNEQVRRIKKKKLGQVRFINRLIQSNNEELLKLQYMAKSVKINNYSSKEFIKNNHIKGRTFEIVEEIIELEEKLKKDISKLIKAKANVKDIIDLVDDLECRLFLQYYYIECLPLSEIELKIDKGLDSLHKIHKKAIDLVKI